MRRLISAMCSIIVGSGLVLACAQVAGAAEKELQGTWNATTAERDGRPAADLVGHRLFFSGDRFEIQSKDRKSLYSGTFRVDASAKPAEIDFEHAEGGLKGHGREKRACVRMPRLGEKLLCRRDLDAQPVWSRSSPGLGAAGEQFRRQFSGMTSYAVEIRLLVTSTRRFLD